MAQGAHLASKFSRAGSLLVAVRTASYRIAALASAYVPSTDIITAKNP
jgi:hypothetical protein